MFAVFVAALTAGAGAQSVPNTPSEPVPVASPAAGATPPPPLKRRRTPLPVLDFIPTFSSSIGQDEFAQNAPVSDPFVRSDIRLSYRISEEFLPRLQFSYFHNAAIADNTLGRSITRTGAYVYPLTARDVLDDFGFSYAFRRARFLAPARQSPATTTTPSGPAAGTPPRAPLYEDFGYIRLGTAYEHRVCCPAAGDPNNLTPADWHAYYLEAQYRTTPITPAKLTFSYTERGSYAPHHVTAAYLAALPPGFHDSNRAEFGLTQTLGSSINLDPATLLFGTFTWGATYFFDNAPFPYLSDTFDYGLQRSVGKILTIRGGINQQTQRTQGYPFPSPNTLHRVRFVLTTDFHVGL